MNDIVLPKLKTISLIDKYYALQLGCYFTEVFERDNMRFAFCSTIDSPIWNHVYLEKADSEEVDNIERKEIAEFRNRHRNICIYIPEEQDHIELTERGYKEVDNEVWMVSDESIIFNKEHKLTYTKVVGIEDLKLFSRIVAECFEPEYGVAIELEYQQRYPKKNILHFIGWWKGLAVSACSIYYDKEMCNIHNVSVLPEFRKKGFGNDTIRFIRNYAKSLKRDYMILQSDGGDWREDFYYKNGFLRFFRRLGYTKDEICEKKTSIRCCGEINREEQG